MVRLENMSFLSTFRPADIGSVELEILDHFANTRSSSAYQIFTIFKKNSGNRSISYKNIHKRVIRLLELNLIYKIEGNFDRGAKHYRISTYGLIIYLNNIFTENHKFITFNKDNKIIQTLLLEYFEEKTIDSLYFLKAFPARDIGDYLQDCCSLIVKQCKNLWNTIKKCDLEEILPSDQAIQIYLSYLDGKPINDKILKEIETYEKKLLDKIKNSNNLFLLQQYKSRDYESYQDSLIKSKLDIKSYKEYIKQSKEYENHPPFPLGLIYIEMNFLTYDLEDKITSLVFNLVSQVGHFVNSEQIKTQDELEESLRYERDDVLINILKDKKFLELIKEIKDDFNIGFKQFIYYDR